MDPVQFTGISRTNNIKENDNKKFVKRAVTAAVVTGTVVGTGVLVYKKRNSKQVQNTLSFVKENVLKPVHKKAVSIKEKAKELYDGLRAKIGHKGETPEAPAGKNPVQSPKKPAKAKAGKKVKAENRPQTKKPADTPKKKKIQTKNPAKNPAQNPAGTPVDNPSIPPVDNPPPEPTVNKNPVERLLDTAKDNAGKLRVAAAGLGAGAALGATGAGVVQKVNEITENGLEKGEKIILTEDGKTFNGYFKTGKAYNEDGTPFSGKLTYVYNSGNKSTSGFDEEDQMTFGEKRDIRKTIMTYNNGVLRKATYFSDIDTPIPTFIKQYNERGKLVKKFTTFTPTGERGKLAPGELFDYGIVQNPADQNIKTPVMLKRHIIKEDGTEVYKYYRKNVDENGAIQGKPLYAFSTETKTLPNGNVQTDFYAPDCLGRGADFLVKTATQRPDGITKITMMTRDSGMAQGEAINGSPKSILTLDKSGRAVSYKLLTGIPGYDGLIRLRGGKIITINDESHYAQIGHEIGTAFQVARLSRTAPKPGDKISDEIYVSKNYVSKIGISYYENGNVKSISTYQKYSDFPDFTTFFDKEGRPTRDVSYTTTGEEVIFSPKYVFNNPAPTLPDDADAIRDRIMQSEAEVVAQWKEEQLKKQTAEALAAKGAKPGEEHLTAIYHDSPMTTA